MLLEPALYNCCLCELGMSGVQLYEDSRDNYKILRTLERHFGAIAGSPVPGIPQMLLPMFNALRLVWAISTHYSDDTHMCALLQRMAYALCGRAQHSVVIQACLCRKPISERSKGLLSISAYAVGQKATVLL